MLWEFRAGLISTLKGKVGLAAERSSTSIDRLTTFPENVTCLFLEKTHTQMGSSFFTCIHCRAEKAVAPHSSTLAWKTPWTEEPGSLQSMGSQRVGHDWATSLSLYTFVHWRRKWQPTPVFLPGESQGRGSLVGCCLGVAQNRTRLKRLSSSSSSHCRESICWHPCTFFVSLTWPHAKLCFQKCTFGKI